MVDKPNPNPNPEPYFHGYEKVKTVNMALRLGQTFQSLKLLKEAVSASVSVYVRDSKLVKSSKSNDTTIFVEDQRTQEKAKCQHRT